MIDLLIAVLTHPFLTSTHLKEIKDVFFCLSRTRLLFHVFSLKMEKENLKITAKSSKTITIPWSLLQQIVIPFGLDIKCFSSDFNSEGSVYFPCNYSLCFISFIQFLFMFLSALNLMCSFTFYIF